MKEKETLFETNWRIITGDRPLRNPQELFCLLEVKTQLHKIFETETTLDDILLTVYTIQIWKYKVLGHPDALTRSGRHVIFKELSCWRWENVAPDG